MVEVKIKGHESAQARVCIYNTGLIEFWSYSTMVIRATPVKNFHDKDVDSICVPVECSGIPYILQCTGLYSATTRRQISWFLAEYFSHIEYKFIKGIAGETGDVVMADLTRDIKHLIDAA